MLSLYYYLFNHLYLAGTVVGRNVFMGDALELDVTVNPLWVRSLLAVGVLLRNLIIAPKWN